MESERCQNPLCGAELGPRVRKRRFFCPGQCKMDTWVLRRAAQLLSRVSAQKKLGILAGLLSANRNQRETNGNNQWKISGKKTYICAKWPYLAIGKRVKFEGGLFETDDPELQKMIEGNKAFGAQILRA